MKCTHAGPGLRQYATEVPARGARDKDGRDASLLIMREFMDSEISGW